jgi:nucleoside-diphosphate-sugar epimerase
VSEDHPLNPTDVNGINNIAGELYHRLYNDIYNLKSLCLRLTNVYGPRHQMRHSKQGFLNWFIRQAIDNETIRIYGDGSQLRDFNYVDDVINAILLAADNDDAYGRVYNLGSENPVSVSEIANKIIEFAGSGRLEKIPYPEGLKSVEVGDYYADISRIKTEIGWRPETRLEDGLLKTIRYYRKNKRHYWNENDRENT